MTAETATKLARKAHLLIDFLAVVEEGGVRGAAGRIHLSQSALTRRIQELEERLGVSLFERTARGMALTTSGEILLRHARSISQSFAHAVGEIADLVEGASGELRLAAGTAWAPGLVPDAIAQLQQRLPGLHVWLLTQTGDALQRLADGHLDVMVGAEPPLHRDVIEYEPLLDIEQRIFARIDHPVHQCELADAEHLAAMKWIWLGESFSMRPSLDRYFLDRGASPPGFSVRTSSVHVAMQLLQRGEYLVLLPSTLTRLAAASRLVPVRLDGTLLRYSAGLIYRAGTSRLRAFSVFRECLIAGVNDL